MSRCRSKEVFFSLAASTLWTCRSRKMASSDLFVGQRRAGICLSVLPADPLHAGIGVARLVCPFVPVGPLEIAFGAVVASPILRKFFVDDRKVEESWLLLVGTVCITAIVRLHTCVRRGVLLYGIGVGWAISQVNRGQLPLKLVAISCCAPLFAIARERVASPLGGMLQVLRTPCWGACQISMCTSFPQVLLSWPGRHGHVHS